MRSRIGRRAAAAVLTVAAALSHPAAGNDMGDNWWNAVANGDSAMVARLIGEGAAVDLRDGRGRTALLLATHANRVELARVLIEAGADVNAKDSIQDSPYLYAGARGHDAILELTLTHGADLTSTNRYGGTALIPAAERGHVETVRRLIAAGVDVDHVNRLHWTALLEAVILGDGGPRHQRIVELLLAAGCRRRSRAGRRRRRDRAGACAPPRLCADRRDPAARRCALNQTPPMALRTNPNFPSLEP